jgi:hypothetical protein
MSQPVITCDLFIEFVKQIKEDLTGPLPRYCKEVHTECGMVQYKYAQRVFIPEGTSAMDIFLDREKMKNLTVDSIIIKVISINQSHQRQGFFTNFVESLEKELKVGLTHFSCIEYESISNPIVYDTLNKRDYENVNMYQTGFKFVRKPNIDGGKKRKSRMKSKRKT